MKKIASLMFFVFLMFGFIHNSIAAFETTTETQVSGTLNRVKSVYSDSSEGSPDNCVMEYQLKLDKPMVFSPGTKSARAVSAMKLDVPDALKQKVLNLDGKHVTVQGTMNCTMLFSPWTAICDLYVKQIDTENKK